MTTNTSGRDLARLALDQYKASAKSNPQQPRQSARHPVRNARTGDRRDPAGLGNVLIQLADYLGWQEGVQVGDILDRWAELTVPPVRRPYPARSLRPERRVLELRPCSPAYAAQLRLLGGQLARQINDKVGAEAVRAIKPLAVGAVTVETSSRPAAAPAPEAPATAALKARDVLSARAEVSRPGPTRSTGTHRALRASGGQP